MDDAARTRDEWLALRCQAADPGAFEELVLVMERPLLYYATKLTGQQDNALEVVQEVWIRALRSVRKLKDPGCLRPWLYRIAHGVVVDRIKRDRSRERAEEIHIEEFQEAADPTFDGELAAVLHSALDEIEPRQREVLTLFFLEGFSVAEISGIVDAPEGTVKSRLHYAKKALKTAVLRGGYGKR
jgi:RNA polymerase sigma-70 factor, ECF subfamily